MSPDHQPLELSMPSDLRYLCVARVFMEEVCRAGRFDQADTGAIVAAVHEALSNVIRHAHQDCPNASVLIRCYPTQKQMEVQLLDEGAPFDLDAVPALDPSELRIGGRGIFLMRRLMDELGCRPRQGCGNVLRMVKYRSRESYLSDCG